MENHKRTYNQASQTEDIEQQEEEEEVPQLGIVDQAHKSKSMVELVFQKIKNSTEFIRNLVLIIVFGMIIFGLIHNFFAPAERDLPTSYFEKLYSVLVQEQQEIQALNQGQARIGSLNEQKRKSPEEWPNSPKWPANLTRN